MELADRYEILDTIASGDFATVYRARDGELHREVAIKQIHEQFLGDPAQLERYWHEAQLLASLQHPNVVTIYDIVRAKGWLILELMRGSLEAQAQGEPMDLNHLRVAMLCTLNALRFLHKNGIIHGDVKPSNMLTDAQSRVKLGDFGLARRASSKEGSLLKGTTKYMAPELVSDQFGPVGPASDLYSLGFSAYELMCGGQFETLFPGLDTFGRDRQIAWLMWHAAPDRKLPEIAQVLEGVPEELAQVIQRLVAKDQSERFQTAEEVIQILRSRPGMSRPIEQGPSKEEVAAAEAAKKKRLRRIGAICAMVCSLLLSVVMLLPSRPKQAPTPGPVATRGIVRDVDIDRRFLVLEATDGTPKEISINRQDEVFINDHKETLRSLMPGDRVAVEVFRDASGRYVNRIIATREDVQSGHIHLLEADEGMLTVDVGAIDETMLLVRVPLDLKITFNGKTELDGQPVALEDLAVDDRVNVHHIAETTGRLATELVVTRVVSFDGTVRDIDLAKDLLTVAVGEAPDETLLVLPFAAQCNVTVNHRSELRGQLLKPKDIEPGDRVTVAHDTQIQRVDAYRVLGQAGVVQTVYYSAGTLDVLVEGQETVTNFLAIPPCEITFGGVSVTLDDLRAGDRVDITHDSPDAKTPQALTIAARRPADPSRWAILVGIQDYDDASVTPLDYPIASAELLRQTLIDRYGLLPEQALLLADVSRVRLEQGINGLLARPKPEDKVLVYFAGHAYRDDAGKVYLAPKNVELARLAGSGLALQELVDSFEKCAAGEKLLLLDCSHIGTGDDLRLEPSTAEMLESLASPRGRARLRTVTAIASCSPGERGAALADRGHSLFAASLADGYLGRADKNQDNRLEATELFAFLRRDMSSRGKPLELVQTPFLMLPDNTPPRLSDEAKAAIRTLASHVAHERINVAEVEESYVNARKLSGNEIEPKLIWGLVLLKGKQRTEAARHLEELRIGRPTARMPRQALAWLQFEKRAYDTGVKGLTTLIDEIPMPKSQTLPYPEATAQIFQWTGKLREFAATVVDESYRASAMSLRVLDAAVAKHGSDAQKRYEQGRNQTRDVESQFNADLEMAANDAVRARLRVERKQLPAYAAFPYGELLQEILAGLDD